MKKTISILLMIAMLLVAAVAVADTELATPSKTTDDLAEVTATVANPVEGKNPTFSVEAEASSEQAAAAEAELTKAQEAGTLEKYFGNETASAIKEVLGDGPISLDELLPLVATDYEEGMGDVAVSGNFATPYTQGEKVAVLIGIVENNQVAWTVYEGIGQADGSVKFVVDAATALKIQNGTALVAVCSK